MNLPEKVSCIIFHTGCVESSSVAPFLFSTKLSYSPREALITLAKDWYTFYLNELSSQKKAFKYKLKSSLEFRDHNSIKYCCIKTIDNNDYLLNYNDNKSCSICHNRLGFSPNQKDFESFITDYKGTIVDGFWPEFHIDFQWSPFNLEESIVSIRSGNYLIIAERGETLLCSALSEIVELQDIFLKPIFKEYGNDDTVDGFLKDIAAYMENLF